MTIADFVGRSFDNLNLEDRLLLAGKWIAMELYTPATLPLRKIEAVGESAKECIASLRSRGLDPTKFEVLAMRTPY